MTRNRKIYRDVQIGNLTNRMRELETELLEQEMKCYDLAERVGTNHWKYEAACRMTLVIRADIERVKTELEEHLQATY